MNFSSLPAPCFVPQTSSRKEGINNLEQLDFEVLSNYVLGDGANELIGSTTLLPNQDLKFNYAPSEQKDGLEPVLFSQQQYQEDFSAQGKFDNPNQPQNQPAAAAQHHNSPSGKRQAKLTPDQQLERRRERNRVLARKTRLRKKIFFESLQKRVVNLKKKNDMLKDIVKRRLGDAGASLLAECHLELPKIVTENMDIATEVIQKNDFNLMKALSMAQKSFVITDPSSPDNPIVYASAEFTELTGYSQEEIVGRNCRFLQGPNTEASKVKEIRQGIEEGKDTSVCLLNYKKDGSTFWNQFFVAALHDVSGAVVNYVGVQCEVSKPNMKPETP
mmetsp:Transcript_3528/g.4959  ORF Transcript_3528/g.4959 Transcript_3528/m.4959 type:complete len:331 (+) Transcript_3528:23-1015(+)